MLWIGGPAASGKTSVATRLARRHGLRWYGADTRTWRHRDRALAAGSPAAHRWERLAQSERWSFPAAELFELTLHEERGPMVVDDLRALPREPLVVAEGTTLPAAAVADPGRAVWLLPTPEFHGALLDARSTPEGPRSLAELLARTSEADAVEHGLPVLRVDGSLDVEETVDAVERLFAGPLADGPRAEAPEERRALLREANEAVVVQLRDFFARPWAVGDADEVERAFVCECGEPRCTADVRATVAAAAAGPLVAAGHARP